MPYLEQVIQETVSNPTPLPAFSGGQAAAYDYFSSQVMPGVNPLPSCTYNKAGNEYTGIRCEYIVLNQGYVQSCAGDATNWLQMIPNLPTSYNGTTIATSDWQTMLQQMAQECADAYSVQKTFNLYNQIINDVFNNTSANKVPQLVDDIGLSEAQQQSQTTLWYASLIEGVTYTVLCGFSAGVGPKKEHRLP